MSALSDEIFSFHKIAKKKSTAFHLEKNNINNGKINIHYVDYVGAEILRSFLRREQNIQPRLYAKTEELAYMLY